MRERAYKMEVYYRDGPVFEPAYFDSLGAAEQAAGEYVGSGGIVVREVRILDEAGRLLKALGGRESGRPADRPPPPVS